MRHFFSRRSDDVPVLGILRVNITAIVFPWEKASSCSVYTAQRATLKEKANVSCYYKRLFIVSTHHINRYYDIMQRVRYVIFTYSYIILY